MRSHIAGYDSLTLAQAAAILQLERQDIRRLIRLGSLEARRLAGDYRIPAREVLRLLKRHTALGVCWVCGVKAPRRRYEAADGDWIEARHCPSCGTVRVVKAPEAPALEEEQKRQEPLPPPQVRR